MVVNLAAAGCGGQGESDLTEAVRAPYIALANREAKSLCVSFTAKVRDQLARGAASSGDCESKVAHVLRQVVPTETVRWTKAARTLTVRKLRQSGNRTYVEVKYGGVRSPRVRLTLERNGSGWQIASPAGLFVVDHCPSNASVPFCTGGNSHPILLVIATPIVSKNGNSASRHISSKRQ